MPVTIDVCACVCVCVCVRERVCVSACMCSGKLFSYECIVIMLYFTVWLMKCGCMRPQINARMQEHCIQAVSFDTDVFMLLTVRNALLYDQAGVSCVSVSVREQS